MSESIGHYELLGVLGTGGFGTVHRARDTRVGRTVAIRVLGDASTDTLNRIAFLESVRPFTHLSHPNVAALFDVGEHHGFPYLVYEFVPGERLGQMVAGRPLNLRRVLDLCTQAADGLADAHALGLFHGALTPSSLVVTPKGHLKILDVGLSLWKPGGAGRHTAVRIDERGAALGPLAVGYMAPEQVLGEEADHRADVFALGAICYELLTGRQPFTGKNPTDTAVKVTQSVPPVPSSFNRDVPVAVDRIVMKALSKSLSDRYSSAAELAADLRAATTAWHQREAAVGAVVADTRRTRSRPAWRMSLLIVLLFAASGVAGWTWRDWLVRAWTGKLGRALTPVVAVVPLTDRGSLPPVTVGAGLAEELVRRMGQIPGVSVRGGASVRALGGLSLTSVASQTKADVVIAGTVMPGRDGWPAFDITVELVDGLDGRTVWSRRYEGPGNDLAATPARMARDLATRLGVGASPSASNSRAALRDLQPDAFEAFLLGVEATAEGDTDRAAQQFEAAVAGDQGFPEAQAALAESLCTGAVFEGRGDYGVIRTRARRIAEEAVTADPDLAAAHLALGLSADTYADAVEHLRQAVALDPSAVRAWLALADLFRDVDPARSASYAARAVAVDPLQSLGAYHEAAAALQNGDRAAALATIARGQAATPGAPWWDALRQRALLYGVQTEPAVAASRSVSDFAPGVLVRSIALVREQRVSEAADTLAIVTRMNPDNCDARALLAAVRRAAGDRGAAVRLATGIQQAAARSSDPASWVRCAATAAAGVGDANGAAAWLERAAADPRALRMFSATSAALSPIPFVRQGLFPWDLVAGQTPVKTALGRIDLALKKVRDSLPSAGSGGLAP